MPTGRARLLFIAVLGGVSAIGPLATDLYLPAMPEVARDLGASQQAIALTISAFLLGLALGQLLSGHLSDTLGRRRPLIAGLLVFSAASLACPFTSSAGSLVALRLVQGFAGAAGIAIANAVVADHTRGTAAARLLSRLALITLLMPILAPLVGAQLLRVVPWQGVFVVQGALGLTLTAGVAFGLKESLPPERRVPFSLRSSGAVMRTLSRDGAFVGLTLTSALMSVAFFAYLAASSFVYQEVYGASPAVFGALFSLNAVGMLGASQLNHRLLARFTPQRLLGAGLLAALLAGLALLTVTLAGGLGLAAVALPLFVLVAAVGAAGPNSTALALSLHPDAAGTASAYFGTVRLAVGATGSVLVGLGGSVGGLSMAVVVAAATLAAAATYAAVAPRVGRVVASFDIPEEATADMPAG
jgi:DHA1 family bicyclomycin/chloramphenicol resistance-like MFS transporter